ncbi:multiple sugar transport system permease protein [Arcanobacterium wilhelmae]|uniref:Multiple sugar transport system permease protein n=1 Tax=Arcanobacterium wilhelmae TaxID=1803177 RepID=A0ABT9NBD6_9ACTO|nr:sugar ABC transporter permease [Arcanobacterium wilhelmae]MDP9801011.1 multiple sugar transport system permease protein [Arcanobacterium wilhelmae]WFN90371.1 sugar ABC transporter permease [Arcanobacterium wilhelmae]
MPHTSNNRANRHTERTGHTRHTRERLAAAAMLAPSAIGVVAFMLAPLLAVAALSFTNWNLLTPPTWAGLANYASLASAGFGRSLLVTLAFSAIAIPLAIAAGLGIALLLKRGLPGSRLLQLFYVLPWIAAPLALGVVWQWVLAPSGLLNQATGASYPWLASEWTALPVIAFVYVWQNVGYISLFFLAALRAVPRSVLEAAALDGAGPIRTFFSITLPLIRPTMFFVSVTSLIASLQVFDLVYGLTGGHPGYPGGTTDVVTARIYSEAFVGLNIGRASAMAVVLTLLIVLVTAAQQRYFRSRLTYELEV